MAIAVHSLTLGAALASAQDTEGGLVGHQVKTTVVPGTELCFDTAQPCTAENRQVSVHLWYPVDPARPPGRPDAEYKSQLYDAPLPAPFLALSWKLNGVLARENAAIDPSGGAFPVIVFSHGATNDPIDYAYTLERIAARGFIVAAPYHTNNTQDDVRRDYANGRAGTTVFPCQDGRPTPCSRGNNIPVNVADRVRDIDRVLDQLPVWFGDRVDVGRAGVLGHSRGTVTALAAAGGTFPLSDPRAASATCQDRVNPRFVSPDGIARCLPLARGMEFGLGRTQADQDNNRVGRIKALMGMAIGTPPVNRAINLEQIAASTVLYSGALDRGTPPELSLAAHLLIGSADKTLGDPDGVLADPLPGVGHRTFASTYCDQTQAAAASADTAQTGRTGDGDGHVDALEYEDWATRAILDFHTAAINLRAITILTIPPPAIAQNGSTRQFCSSATFTNPVDITTVVSHFTGPFDPADAPAAGFATSATLTEQMAEEAVDFFREKLRSETHAEGGVGGTVPATLSLELGGPVTLGAFTPGVGRVYTASTTARVTSTAGDATLTASGPVRLANGAFGLSQPLELIGVPRSWPGPVSNDTFTVGFAQTIGANEPLRTGAYSATVTFTLSTTAP